VVIVLLLLLLMFNSEERVQWRREEERLHSDIAELRSRLGQERYLAFIHPLLLINNYY